MEFSEILTEEHNQIRRAMNVLSAITHQIQQGRSVDIHNVNAILLFLHSFADRCHQAKEESILFPAIRRALRDQQSDSRLDLESLLKEHQEECWLIEQLLKEPQTVALGVRIREANADFGECHITLLMDMLKQVELAFGLKAA